MIFGTAPGSVLLAVLLISQWSIHFVHADTLPFAVPPDLEHYLSAHPISVKSVNETINQSTRHGPLQNASAIVNPNLFKCPVSCADAGTDSSGWTVFHDLNRLALCNQSMLVDFAIHNPLDDPNTHITLYTCSSAAAGKGKLCTIPEENTIKANQTVQLAWSESTSAGDKTNGVAAVQQLQSYVKADDSCGEDIIFAYSQDAVVGLYAGAGITSQNLTNSFLEQFSSYIQSNPVPGSLIAQMCGSDQNTSSNYTLGVALSSNGDWKSVQEAVQTWSKSSCVTGYDQNIDWITLSYLIPAALPSNKTSTNTTITNRTSIKRGSTAPSPYANGTCYTHTVVTNDLCSTLATQYQIAVSDIEKWNSNTWGWMGCDDLQLGQNICLSSGSAPMPVNIPNANCGPQMNGTAVAPAGTDLSTLNECPLNACCDIWGQCGTTSEFCTPSNSTTGAPGTAAKGQNGCISNCGTDIIYSSPPAEFRRIGYFEGFDFNRPCLSESILSVDTSQYTHIHLAFATLNADFSVNVTGMGDNFDLFAGLSGFKRIISFGGWDYSTDASTYDIFREAFNADNRPKVIQNVIQLLNDYELDGVDFDWEYPGEPDIKGIPPSNSKDTDDYYFFFVDLYNAMFEANMGKTISVTAPASYWYLQTFPIDAMSKYLDYIVFMTYDLHGQWDYGNKFVDPGCTAGNCLRSDVNLTETLNALSMITKAGVPSNMIAVGVTSYGRSFQMTTPGCYSEMCTYTGPESGALPGPCTNTAGYLGNGEINQIIAQNGSGLLQFQDDSFSNIVVYGGDQWISYMDDSNKASRTSMYQSLSFGGVADWAIDLQQNGSPLGTGSDTDSSGIVYVPPSVWTDEDPTVNCIPPCSFILPPIVLGGPTILPMPPISVLVTISTVVTVTETYGTTVTTVGSYSTQTFPTVVSIPAYTGNTIDVWGIPILDPGSTTGTITAWPSIQPTPFPIVVTPVWGGTTGVTDGTVTTYTSTVVVYGSYTWTSSGGIETYGGITNIIGGTTGTPVTAIITPHPYPAEDWGHSDSTTTTSSTTTSVVGGIIPKRTAAYSSGKPKTTCTSGCGHRCQHFCDPFCLICPPDFGGLGGLFGGGPPGGGGGGSGGGDGDPSDSSTTTSTSSSSSQSGVTIPAIATFTADPVVTPVGSAALAALRSDIAAVWNSLYPPQTTTSPTTTTTSKRTTTSTNPSWPTNTAINVGSAYCYTQQMGYVSFTLDDAKGAIGPFCNASYVLDPSNTFGFVEKYDAGSYSVLCTAQWANDQAGCGAQKAYSFADSSLDYELCLNAWSTDYFCLDENAPAASSYGGGYVYNSGSGCILLELYAKSD
ncbi:hypothetical protein EIK77_004125 [Talaromyces pinophilus]|nr:hypothetical protein EIK77_004125 [Talaromyces pinophilus]PCH07311.1 Peptidoglycan-binding Lysin subgroup [Penicillium occitanis (nom. inval.)]PCH08528.1 hypothetical protein PENOC_013980 [Penicillium occitanis (nom. inval.)]